MASASTSDPRKSGQSGHVKLFAQQGQDPYIWSLEISGRNELALLFKFGELIVDHGVDVVSGDISSQAGIYHNIFVLHASRPEDFDDASNWCHKLDHFLRQEDVKDQAACGSKDVLPSKGPSAESLSFVSKHLCVNPDLLSVVSWTEVPNTDDAGSGNTGKYHYQFVIEGINQAGLLTYIVLVLYRSGFAIVRATISTIQGHIKNIFIVSTDNPESEHLLRSFLDLPSSNGKDDFSLPFHATQSETDLQGLANRYCRTNDGSPRSSCASEDMMAPMPVFVNDCEGDLVDKFVKFSNGDNYTGSCLIHEGVEKRHGMGVYEYSMLSRDLYRLYRGLWQEDLKHGHGVMFLRGGGAYVGTWKKNQRDGLGLMLDTTGDDHGSMPTYRYEGMWRDDKTHGMGMEETETSSYYGFFSRGHRAGKGVQMSASKSGVTGAEVVDGSGRVRTLLEALEVEMVALDAEDKEQQRFRLPNGGATTAVAARAGAIGSAVASAPMKRGAATTTAAVAEATASTDRFRIGLQDQETESEHPTSQAPVDTQAARPPTPPTAMHAATMAAVCYRSANYSKSASNSNANSTPTSSNQEQEVTTPANASAEASRAGGAVETTMVSSPREDKIATATAIANNSSSSSSNADSHNDTAPAPAVAAAAAASATAALAGPGPAVAARARGPAVAARAASSSNNNSNYSTSNNSNSNSGIGAAAPGAGSSGGESASSVSKVSGDTRTPQFSGTVMPSQIQLPSPPEQQAIRRRNGSSNSSGTGSAATTVVHPHAHHCVYGGMLQAGNSSGASSSAGRSPCSAEGRHPIDIGLGNGLAGGTDPNGSVIFSLTEENDGAAVEPPTEAAAGPARPQRQRRAGHRAATGETRDGAAEVEVDGGTGCGFGSPKRRRQNAQIAMVAMDVDDANANGIVAGINDDLLAVPEDEASNSSSPGNMEDASERSDSQGEEGLGHKLQPQEKKALQMECEGRLQATSQALQGQTAAAAGTGTGAGAAAAAAAGAGAAGVGGLQLPPRAKTSTNIGQKRLVPMRSPILWSEDEIAAFLACLGISREVCRRVRQRTLKGVSALLEMSDSELRTDLLLERPEERLVARQALKRLLEADRWEHTVRGHKSGDLVCDSVLSKYILPLEDLTFLQRISQGGYGTVYRGRLAGREQPEGVVTPDRVPAPGMHKFVAVKEMRGERRVRLYEMLKEACVMASLKHPNICKFVGVVNDTQAKKHYILTELMDCSLFDIIHQPNRLAWHTDLNFGAAIELSVGLGNGLAYIHSNHLVHADLKSSNVLVNIESSWLPWKDNKMIPRICDFGHAAVRAFPSPHHRCGTPHWAAPEALRGEGLDSKADVYSYGVMIWEMMTRELPHRGLSFGQVISAVGWGGWNPDLSELPAEPTEIRKVVRECVAFAPHHRPTCEEAAKRLKGAPKRAKLKAIASMTSFFSCGN